MAINQFSVLSSQFSVQLLLRTENRELRTRVLQSLPCHSYRYTSCPQSSWLLRRSAARKVPYARPAPGPPPARKDRRCQWLPPRRRAQSHLPARSAEKSALCRTPATTLPDAAGICRCASPEPVPPRLAPGSRDTAPAWPRTG